MQFKTKRRWLPRPAWITLSDRNGTNRLHKGRKRNSNLRRLTSMRSNGDWQRRELNDMRSITSSIELLVPVLTQLLILFDGMNTHGLNRTGMRPPNGPGIFGVLAPWTISSWLLTWSTCGALLWPTSGPARMFTSVCLPHMCWKHTTTRLTMIHTNYAAVQKICLHPAVHKLLQQ